jgi:predicted Zn-dependent peptidase
MGNIKPLLKYEENLDKITTKKIKEVANKYFNNNFSTTVIMRKQ